MRDAGFSRSSFDSCATASGKSGFVTLAGARKSLDFLTFRSFEQAQLALLGTQTRQPTAITAMQDNNVAAQ
jgi:hypothetical protein